MEAPILELDGSFLEGGGQIFRNALALSCILRRPIRIIKIRANRPNPGLSHQHLHSLNLLQKITKARVTGNTPKSTEVEFLPGDCIYGGKYYVDTKTAASVSLVLQAVLPVLLFGSGRTQLEIVGGTNVGMSPQVDFMSEVFRPNLEYFGASFHFELQKRGYYPRGGGNCLISISPVNYLKATKITNFGELIEITGWCFVAGRLPERLANEIKFSAEKELKSVACNNRYIESYKENIDIAGENGSGVVLKATTTTGVTIGSDALGERAVNAGDLGLKAAKELKQYIRTKTCIDSYVQDQIILFMAIATGETIVKTGTLTNHTRTAIYVAEIMTGAHFKIEKTEDNQNLITCIGIGIQNQYFK